MFAHLGNDVRYAARRLSTSPGFTVAAIATIALGVGINTGIFSVINGVLFRDIPAPDSRELVSIAQTIEGVPDREGNVFMGLLSTAEYQAYRDRSETLAAVMGHSEPIGTMLGGAEAPRQIGGLLVTCAYFDVLEQQPAMGRGLTEQDCRTGADPVVVLGHEFWMTTYAADPTIIGRTVELSRQLFTVVGIAPERIYSGMFRAQFFAPVSAQPLLLPDENTYENDQASWLFLIGRRNSGIDEVRAELGVIAAQIDQEQAGRSTTLTVERAKPLTIPPFVRGAAMAAGAVVMTAFGLILLIACANVANLLLARGAMRSREFAVRLALGASRARVMRELLIESMLLSVAGGVLGSVLAFWSFQALVAVALPTIMPVGLPSLALDASPDIRVLWVTLALTFGTGLLFGLAPALHASKPDLHSVMKQDSAGAGSGRRGRLQATLVGAQVALCMVLMIGAGLLLRGLYAAHTVDPGFDYRDVTVLSYDYVEDTGHDDDDAFWLRLMEEIGALRGTEAVAYTMREPLGDDFVQIAVRLPGQGENEARFAELNSVTPGYFSAIGLPLLLGRSFTDADLTEDGRRTAIVSESTARNLWPGADPIGQTLLWDGARDDEVSLTIVGVVKDAQVRTLGQIDPYYVYLPDRVGEKLLVKSRADFAATAAGIRGVVRALDPSLPVPVYPLEANVDRWQGISGLVTTLAASLGALALVLAAVGIFGVVAYFVSRRYREIGIRMALGARPRDVVGLILRRTMRPVVVGAVFGVAAAIAISGILSSVLFGVSPVDVIGLGGTTLFVLAVAVAAGALPARRATRVDLIATLHYE
jgi:predicted permease